jgi:hypothetical protein
MKYWWEMHPGNQNHKKHFSNNCCKLILKVLFLKGSAIHQNNFY